MNSRSSLIINLLVLLTTVFYTHCTQSTGSADNAPPPQSMLSAEEEKEDIPDAYAEWETNHGIGPVDSLVFDEKIDSVLVEKGRLAFELQCIYCHKESDNFIGPPMKDIFKKRTPAWTINMILNPEEMVIKDPLARQLYKDYNYSPMQKQVRDVAEARAMLEYFRTL